MQKLITHKNIALACTAALATAVTALPAFAADSSSHTEHLRGVITAKSKNSFKLKDQNGQVQTIKLTSKTGVATATKGDLSNISKGTYIGTANVERDGKHQALEMVIFPKSMKGAGLGNYGWDLSPSNVDQNDMTSSSGSSGGAKTAGSSMTNGTVEAKSGGSMSSGSSMTNGTVQAKTSGSSGMNNGTDHTKTANSMSSGSSMTNGTVTHSSSASNTMTLKVNYGKGTKTIVVPKNVPTVKLAPGKVSDLDTGAHAFVIVSGNGKSGYTAKKIIVGKNGVVPPM